MMALAAVTALMIASMQPPLFPEADAHNRHGTCRGVVTSELLFDRRYDGLPMNNPDRTFYPGDGSGFVFEFRFGPAGACGGTWLSEIYSTGAIRISDIYTVRSGKDITVSGQMDIDIGMANDCHGKSALPPGYLAARGGNNGYGGNHGWNWERTAVDDCGTITASAKYVRLHTCPPHSLSGDPPKCRARPTIHTVTDTILPLTKAPATETIFTEHVLHDPYGYNATNPDMTNYVWDPIPIEHEADFDFSRERAGTISFEYERIFDPLVEEDAGFECHASTCTGTLEIGTGNPLDAAGIGFLPYAHKVANGGGMYVYAAPDLSGMGNHTIRYDVKVFNTGRLINTHTNSTSQLVVAYDPVFAHYEYPVLSDGGRYSYEDRQGMVIYYAGSRGSGPDDNAGLNPDRRSRINALYPHMQIRSLAEVPHPPDWVGPGTATIKPPILLEDERMEWDSIHHINGTDTAPWHTTGGAAGLGSSHAMFSAEGYGILRLFQDMADLIFDEKNWNRWYWNATTYNEVASDRWAGHASFRNWNYTYQYPHTPFSQWFNMTAYDGDGSVLPTGMHVEITVINPTHDRTDMPEFISGENVVVLLDDYMHAKTMHDLGDVPVLGSRNDTILADGVAGEMYSMSNTATGTDGSLSAWINKTGIEWSRGYVPGGSILGMDMYDSLDSEALMLLNMTSGRNALLDTFTFDFWADMHMEFIQGEYHTLEPIRLHGSAGGSKSVSISVPEKFGTVKSVRVGADLVAGNVECHPSCMVYVPVGGPMSVENYWGGMLLTRNDIAEPVIKRNVAPNSVWASLESNLDYLYLMAAAGLVGFVAYRALGRFLADAQP